jgi:hypothetical protein
MADTTTIAECDDLNHRDYVDNLTKGAIDCAISALEHDFGKDGWPIANALRLARDRIEEVLEARAAPGDLATAKPQEVQP